MGILLILRIVRILFGFITSVILFLLETCIFARLPFFPVAPNLLIVAASSFGFMRGEYEGIYVGFVCGFLMDVFFGSVLGLNTMLFMLTGYFNGKLNAVYYPSDLRLPLLAVLGSDLSIGVIQYCIFFLLRGRFDFFYYLIHIILPEVVFTLVSLFVLYPLLLFINRKLEEVEEKEARKFV